MIYLCNRHWYISQGLPTIIGPGLALPALIGVASLRTSVNDRPLLYIIVVIITVYSTQPHKEFRFVLPVLPLVAVIAGRGLVVCADAGDASRRLYTWVAPRVKWLLLLNIPLTVYFGRWHQAGPISGMWSVLVFCWQGCIFIQ